MKKRRTALINALENRFYVKEQGVLVSNGLSTELIGFPSDLRMSAELLGDKIRNAITYATAFKDIEEINALHRMAPLLNDHLSLGLYLYFADECSRLNCSKTFLTAMREAKATLSLEEGQNFNRERLFDQTMKALKILGLDKSHGNILEEWWQKGSYTIEGQRHWSEKKGEGQYVMHGAYARLASAIESPQRFLSVNLAISYALGNKNVISGMEAKEALSATDRLTTTGGQKTEEGEQIQRRIDRGDEIREERIRAKIHETFREFQSNDFAATKKHAIIKDTLAQLPDEALEMLYRKGYMCAYTNDSSVRNCYPKKDLLGISESQNRLSRESKALRQNRYRLIFLSNGIRLEPHDLEYETGLKARIIGQSLLHEIMHMSMSYLDDEQRNRLKKAIETLSRELHQHARELPQNRLKTIDTNMLAEVADYRSSLYDNYDVIQPKGEEASQPWEEVACNLYGLMHTEYAGNHVANPLKNIACFHPVMQQLEETMKIALEQCREDYAHVKLEKNDRKFKASGQAGGSAAR